MTGIYLGLGTNLGERLLNLSRCLKILSLNSQIQLLKISSVYESEPYGLSCQPLFLNLVVKIGTNLEPFQLLTLTQQVEQQIGRKKTFRWGPRVIDIDILSYDDNILNHPMLYLPHRELHLRQFVLLPLKEIAACFVHPILKLSIEQMLTDCPDTGFVNWFMDSHKLIPGLG